jgi:hypothetical protein
MGILKFLMTSPKTSAVGLAALGAAAVTISRDPNAYTTPEFWTQVLAGLAALFASDHKTSATASK